MFRPLVRPDKSRRSSPWFLVVALLSAMLTTVAPGPASAAEGPLGISLPYLERELAFGVIDNAAAMGVDYVRFGIPGTIETSKGNFGWGYYDAIVDRIRDRGMQRLAVLGFSPDWAHPGVFGDKYPYNNPNDFADYVRAVEVHFGDRLDRYEIWNEPNIRQFWMPRPDPTKYAEHLRFAVYTLRSLGSAFIVTGGLAPAAGGLGSEYVRPSTFLDAAYKAGGPEGADAVGLHPYAGPEGPTGTHPDNFFSNAHEIRYVMGLHGQTSKQVWATELGVSTCGNPGDNFVSAATQATWAGQYIDGWRNKGSWAGVPFWYTASDLPNASPKIEQCFGYLYPDATADSTFNPVAKPARAELNIRT